MITPLLLIGAAAYLLLATSGKKGGQSGESNWKRPVTAADLAPVKLGPFDFYRLNSLEAWNAIAGQLARMDGTKVDTSRMVDLAPAPGAPPGKAALWDLGPAVPNRGKDVSVPFGKNLLSGLCYFCNEMATKYGRDTIIFIRGVSSDMDGMQFPGQLILLSREPSPPDVTDGPLSSLPGQPVLVGRWSDLRKNKVITDDMCLGKA